jgi:hypothetical protein
MNVSIERKTVLADNRKKLSLSSVVKTGASLTEKEENAAIATGFLVGTGLTVGSIYAVYKGHYALGFLTFIAAGPLGVAATFGVAYLLYKNDSTGV